MLGSQLIGFENRGYKGERKPQRKQWSSQYFSDLVDKFKDIPLLRCYDCILVEALMSTLGTSPEIRDRTLYTHRDDFNPEKDYPLRIYTTAWDLRIPVTTSSTCEGAPPPSVNSVTISPFNGWERFSSFNFLIHRLLDIARPVKFRGSLPTMPFQVLGLDSFYFESDQTLTPRTATQPAPTDEQLRDLEYNESFQELEGILDDEDEDEEEPIKDNEQAESTGYATLVDGRPSCKFHLLCTDPCLEHSAYCSAHHRIFVKACEEKYGPLDQIKKRRNVTIDRTQVFRQKHVEVIQPHRLKDIQNFRKLRYVLRNFIVWVIDIEFGTVKNRGTVPYILTVREYSTGKIILSTPIDYGSVPLDDLQDILYHEHMKGKPKNPVCPPFLNKMYFAQFYENDFTCGMSLQAVRNMLRELGFDPDTHRILSWFTTVDMTAFWRAIFGYSDIFCPLPYKSLIFMGDKDNNNCLQPINVTNVFRSCTNLRYLKCGFVFHSLFHDEILRMHHPDTDTYAMVKSLWWFMDKTADWEI